MGARYCITGSEWGIEAEECGIKVLGGEVEVRGRRICLVSFSQGVLGGRQREQAVRGEIREGKWEGAPRTTYTLALPPRDGSWELICWVE
jgi:hypothetical protein